MSTFKVIGLCGRSGTGKGYVCARFAAFGIPSIDTDAVYRGIVADKDSACLSELVSFFGREILDSEGHLCRKSLSTIVFSDREKLGVLNSITHRYILEETEALIEKARSEGKRAVIVDAPVLFESGFDRICHIKICVTAPDEVCIKRICKRDSRTADEARVRLASQKSEETLRDLCDEVIVNDDNADVETRVREIVERYALGGENEE